MEAQARGESIWNSFEYLKGDSAKINLFDGIDFSWGRITKAKYFLVINKIVNSYNIKEPSQSIRLIQLRKMIETVEDQFWKEKKVNGSGPINITVLWSFYPNDHFEFKENY